jgi:hypothetical protein
MLRVTSNWYPLLIQYFCWQYLHACKIEAEVKNFSKDELTRPTNLNNTL